MHELNQTWRNKTSNHCKSRDKASKKNNSARHNPRQILLKPLLSMALSTSRVQLQDNQPKQQTKVMKQVMNTMIMTSRKMTSCKWLSLTQPAKHRLDPRKQLLALFKTRKLTILLFHARVHPVILTLLCAKFQ